MRVKITADSTCDLSPELIRQYGIQITPLSIVTPDGPKHDGTEITPDDIYRHVAEHGTLLSTAAVNVEEYIQVFTRLLETCDEIVHFTISASMSSCYQNACIAAQECGNVFVVDSKNLSTGIGHLVLDAAELASNGLTGQQIKAELDARREKLDVSFVVDTPDYLRKGGRCSALEALGANLLKIKPCIEVCNGAMGPGKKYRGNLSKCLPLYVRDRLAAPDTVDPRRIFITHSGIDPAITQLVQNAVLDCVPFEQVLVTRAGGTVSTHCGPNTLGILFYHK